MPNNKSNKNKKNGRKSGGKPSLPLTFRPIPNMKINVVFAQEIGYVESAAGLGAAGYFRVNGAFDPDQTAGGSSAIGFNNYAGLFTSYRVHAMRFRFEGAVSYGTVTNFNLATVTVTPNPRQVTLPANAALWGIQPGAMRKVIAPATFGGKNVVTFDRVYYPWQIAKITKDQYLSEADYSSLVSTVPVKEMYLALGVNSMGGGNPVSLNGLVTITYLVEFFEPALLT